MIENYKFGEIIIDGKKYNSDLIIYPDNIDYKWWRKEGHLLQKEDLKNLQKYNPDLLIVGTGSPGLMKVDEKTKEYLHSVGISLIVQNTEKACETYNGFKDKTKVIVALHLTC